MATGLWTGGPHQTSGLSGYPARDYGAPGGSPVYAWDNLRVRRISGASGYRGGGFGGYNLYLQDRRGNEYFVTHVENLRVKVGSTLQPGQQFANIGNYGSPHAHVGYTGGDPSSVLGLKPEMIFTPGGAVAGSQAIRATAPKSKGSGGVTGFIKDLPSVSGVDVIEGITGSNLPDIDAGSPLDVITGPLDAIRWVGKNWDRMGYVFAGFILLLVGLILMGRAVGVAGARRMGGDVVNRIQFGPTVERARRDPSLSRKKAAYLPGDEPKPKYVSTAPAGGDDIPF